MLIFAYTYLYSAQWLIVSTDYFLKSVKHTMNIILVCSQMFVVPLSDSNESSNVAPPGFILHEEFVSKEFEEELLACVKWDDANGLFIFLS